MVAAWQCFPALVSCAGVTPPQQVGLLLLATLLVTPLGLVTEASPPHTAHSACRGLPMMPASISGMTVPYQFRGSARVYLQATTVEPQTVAVAEPDSAAEPCCQGNCTAAGHQKYYSVASAASGKPHCGECCLDPKNYNLYATSAHDLATSAQDLSTSAPGLAAGTTFSRRILPCRRLPRLAPRCSASPSTTRR